MLFDSNVWLALAFSSHPHHARVQAVVKLATAKKPLCFCRATQQSFLRLATTPILLRTYGAEGLTNLDAGKLLTALIAMPTIRTLPEPTDLEKLWLRIAALRSASPKVWMDAYLAAFCILHKREFVTLDRDFRNLEKHGFELKLLA